MRYRVWVTVEREDPDDPDNEYEDIVTEPASDWLDSEQQARAIANNHVATMCRVLGVSTQGYYAWRKRPSSPRAMRDAALLTEIRRIHDDSRQTYGAPRVHVEMIACGTVCGRKRVAKIMRHAGLVGRCGRRPGPKTTRRSPVEPPVPDLVKRVFTSDRPNAIWTADIERHEALLDRAVMKGHRLRALAGVR